MILPTENVGSLPRSSKLQSAITNYDAGKISREELEREIAERRKAEQALAYERFLLTTLMEYSPDHIYFKDRESRFLRISTRQSLKFGLASPDDAVGKTDAAFGWLERALDERDSLLVWLRVEPRLDKLRDDPRFADLVERVGLRLWA